MDWGEADVDVDVDVDVYYPFLGSNGKVTMRYLGLAWVTPMRPENRPGYGLILISTP